MLVKLTQSFLYVPTMMIRGSVVDIPDETAAEWVTFGMAELVQPIETATKPSYETATKRTKRSQ